MKKSTLLFASVFLICMTSISVRAQDKEEIIAPHFGIKGGMNFSNLLSKDADKTKILAGFNAGVFLKMPVSRFFAVQPELYYTTKGAEVTYNNLLLDGTARFTYNYIEVPLLLVVNITDNFNVHLGPYAAIMISGKVKNESNINLFNYEENIDTQDYNRLDAGLTAGLGVDFGLFGMGVRYNYGLTKVGKEQTFMGKTYIIPDASNTVLNFYLSLAIK